MKQWITLIASAAIICSCSKENLREESLQTNDSAPSTALRSVQQGTFVSDWQQYTDWTKTDEGNVSVFTLIRKTPEVTSSVINGGLALTYAKVTTTDPLYSSFNQPKMLPFFYLPEAEKPYQQTFYFTDAVSNGNITIAYRVPFTKEMMPPMAGGASLQGLQFQHVVMTKEFLDNQGLSADQVRNYYTYDQVMNLVSQ